MNRRHLLALTCGFALAGCNTPFRRFFERVTLVVATPEGEMSGSSVLEFETKLPDGWWDRAWRVTASTGLRRGEATAVDLGSRGVLLALLIKDDRRPKSLRPLIYPAVVCPEIAKRAEREGGNDPTGTLSATTYDNLLNQLKPQGDVPFERLSLLVRIRDPKDPRTIERVDPLDLASAFGPGIRLARASFAITDGPVTRGLDKKLPWLTAPHKGAGVVPYEGPLVPAGTLPFIYELLYNDFWENMDYT